MMCRRIAFFQSSKGMLKVFGGGAVVIGVVRVRRLGVARNCERQGGDRERTEVGGSLQRRDRRETVLLLISSF